MRSVGYKTERYAELWLFLHGYKPVARNFTVRGGEIDLVMKKGEYIVFIEVKARRKGSMVSGLEAVGRDKERHLRYAAAGFLKSCDKRYKSLQPRFDVICVTIGRLGLRVTEHIENAF